MSRVEHLTFRVSQKRTEPQEWHVLNDEGTECARLWGEGVRCEVVGMEISVMERCVEMCVHEKGERHVETCVCVCLRDMQKCIRDVLGHRRKGGVGRECV